MRMIKFTQDMAPHTKGDTRVVPDDVATRLIRDGAAVHEPNAMFDPPKKKKADYLTRDAR